jgi:hypothetical protein
VHFETESILVDATWATGHIDVTRIVDDSDGVGSVKGNYFEVGYSVFERIILKWVVTKSTSDLFV